MKMIFGIIVGFIFVVIAGVAIANNSIPQVSGESTTNNAESSLLSGDTPTDSKDSDYQKKILSDPTISDVARTKALTGNGGNTAVIVQEGNSNKSTITQSGDDNYASQTQEGEFNDIQLEQQGDHNRSDEKQTGKYNHKVIIQNGQREETTTIEQVGEKPDEEKKP